ncbi:FAD-binding oxidoreductase [Rhodalgimonas zhirmunskyi]|uniref:FAD-binding oxidoreductase n=1 Tax=Rhodalgimonas zhirmunskyi TaxID=2964767 RepID=A0AAJ1X740_9RHOB|nr:FAD-binding oxidoreductase [Rhodoalgimonas zhirmunskyi]MDQ2095854.1 FAD-binding oxidoreductase [Rhodoalgimonas zhirmunskyi]
MIEKLKSICGENYVLSGDAADGFSHDFTRQYAWSPLAVVRPENTAQVAEVVKLANETQTPIVPVSGNTGLAGGTKGEGAIMLSLDRMNRIREIRAEARIAIVEAGVILSQLREAVEAQGLIFPLTFGAQGSAMIGGNLSTNAGGSNVLRYGNTRDLVLGIEAVLPTGEVMDIMSELHKDNSGYNLKHLLIGAEGTLGIITAAVVKLAPKPRAYATAMVAAPSLADALTLLNRLQIETGGAVEAFEYMPRSYIDSHLAVIEGAREPFDAPHNVNILVEIAATAPQDATPGADGTTPLQAHFEELLAEFYETGAVLDATLAQNEAQRREMWARREAAAEITLTHPWRQTHDVCVPVDKVGTFIARADETSSKVDPGSRASIVSHLGDGNIHYSVWFTRNDAELADRMMEALEDIVIDLGGSFSAEHGIGVSKRPSMARRKNKAALATMQAIKHALDPNGIMNPGKVLP